MTSRNSLLTAAFFGMSAVALGAFAAHGLKSYLEQSGYTHIFETAVRFQFYHTIALLAIGILIHLGFNSLLRYSALCFTVGIIFFSGSLYGLAFTSQRFFGPITPIGGLLLMTGWLLMLISIFKTKKAS